MVIIENMYNRQLQITEKKINVYFKLDSTNVVVKSSFPCFNEATICIYVTDKTYHASDFDLTKQAIRDSE